MWGLDSTNSRGRQIEQFISDNCLCLLNNKEKTYFHEPTRTFHSLDLAICSPQLLPLLNFTVGSYLYNSDHFLLIVCHADRGGAIHPPPRYLFHRADWDAFTQLGEITDTIVSTSDITEAVQNVIDCIITPLILHTSLQVVAVQILIRTLAIVCCVYLPPHDVISQQDHDNLVDQITEPFILLRDFNGHSILWDADCTSSRGRQIEQFMSNCLCLFNNDEKTYFHEPTRTFHSLDLAICSPELLSLLNLTVGGDLFNSDHFPLIVSHSDSSGATPCPLRFLFQRADWITFSQLANITENIVSTADISETVQQVVNTIRRAANNTTPSSFPTPKENFVDRSMRPVVTATRTRRNFRINLEGTPRQ
ncbi:hypothetical protein AVEN_196991-1 [Araneus ventricosus]|uniref:Endonuclease/exonuclease/phosphatase domain-containing protein n=1 Tax=Araneus ventricosus TaxID=182803 RepID=A0A4Y2EE81_ARAVE|nr:hypothetical protein AVEN_196991-1 [Araneus ventricosus]